MPDSNPQRRRHQIENLRRHLARPGGSAFAEALPADQVEAALLHEGVGWRHKAYTPRATLWAFLARVARPDACCRAAAARVLARRIGHGRPPCRPSAGGYCKARTRLPEGLPRRLTRAVGRGLHRKARGGWRWRGRPVEVADGTALPVPDTPANQRPTPNRTLNSRGWGSRSFGCWPSSARRPES